MKGALRFAIAAGTAALVLGPEPASAQDTPATTGNPPAADAVGPRELQDFSLTGPVTRAADEPAPRVETPPPAIRQTRHVSETSAPPATASAAEVAPRPRNEPVAARISAKLATTPAQLQVAAPSSTPAVQLPAASVAPASFPPAPPVSSPVHGFSLLPWLLALAVAVGAGLFFLFRRNQQRQAFAGGPRSDLFVPPQPASPPPRAAPVPQPAPAPAPVPAAAPAPPPIGIVSTNLRPWLDIGVTPLRCIVTEETVTIEFELDLLNSGNGPARDIHVAAVIVNAGEAQEQQLASFFGQQPGPGERIDAIQPLKHMSFPTRIVVARDQVQVLEVGDRQVFVPLLALNAHYGWGSRKGQTSVAFLVGREGNGDKLAPFRVDLGPRTFRGLGARLLPSGVRT